MSTLHVGWRCERSVLDRLMEGFRTLTVIQRQALCLYGVDHLPLVEVGRQLGLAGDAVRAIFAGACQRLAQYGAAKAPHPHPAGPCPPWCPNGCLPDGSDGSRLHMSAPRPVAHVAGDAPDVSLSRLDPEDGEGQTLVSLFLGDRAHADMTPDQALLLAELFREDALRAAGTKGVEMPVERLRLGDEIRTKDGWEVVEVIMVDGWCCGIPPRPGHLHPVKVSTNGHDEDDVDPEYRYDMGDLVRVRRVVS